MCLAAFSKRASKALEIQKCLSQGCITLPYLKRIHAHLLRVSLDQDQYILNMVVRAYFESGHPTHACTVFTGTMEPNIFLWNTMIRGFVTHEWFCEAVQVYDLMRVAGLSPDNFTFPFAMKACARLRDLAVGRKMHNHMVKLGFDSDLFVKTSLVCLYAKCGHLAGARILFDEMGVRNAVTWTAIISGYMEDGQYDVAIGLFRQMLEIGSLPDAFTLVRVLTACSQLGDVKNGESIHRYVEGKHMCGNVFVATALLDMYTKSGHMEKARRVFDGMGERDVVTWSAMIGGYSLNGLPKEALDLFFIMLKKNVKPDCFTIVGVLSACARLGALELGNWASGLIERDAFFSNPVLGTALIDLYSKCGSISHAWDVFKAMKERDIVVWNAIISGLGMIGYVKTSLALFNQIEKLGLKPDGNTFLGLLCGCTHAGLVEDGRRFLRSMSTVYLLAPKIEHYGCMVDLLGRTGLLKEAHQLTKDMPFKANAVVWGALLAGCRIHRDTQLAEHVLKHLIDLEPQNAGNYVLLSNIYSSSGRWDDAANLRLLMHERGIQKSPGRSWIEIKGRVHEFRVGDQAHPMSDKIYSKLDELATQLKILGFEPKTDVVLFDIEEEEKEHSLGHHSEKLAIAYGLIATKSEDPIRVVKNLRVCNDCHAAIKLISKITKREIIVRDNNRFHAFKEGACSCNDFW